MKKENSKAVTVFDLSPTGYAQITRNRKGKYVVNYIGTNYKNLATAKQGFERSLIANRNIYLMLQLTQGKRILVVDLSSKEYGVQIFWIDIKGVMKQVPWPGDILLPKIKRFTT